MGPLSRIPVGGWFHKRKHPNRSRSWWPHPSPRSNDFLAGPAAHSITHHRQMKSWMRCWVSLNRNACHTGKENDQLLNTDDNTLFERSLKWSKEKSQKHINVKRFFQNYVKPVQELALSARHLVQHEEWGAINCQFYNQSIRGYRSGVRFNFYKKGTQPKQFRKSSTSQKSRK